MPPPRIRNISEPERFALILGQAAELQPHQRHQLRIFADGLIHDPQQSPAAKFVDVIPQIPVRHQYLRASGSMKNDSPMQQNTRKYSPAL